MIKKQKQQNKQHYLRRNEKEFEQAVMCSKS